MKSIYKKYNIDSIPLLRDRLHMSMEIVPNIIHFIWIGKWDNKNNEYIDIWRKSNPDKQIFIWVDICLEKWIQVKSEDRGRGIIAKRSDFYIYKNREFDRFWRWLNSAHEYQSEETMMTSLEVNRLLEIFQSKKNDKSTEGNIVIKDINDVFSGFFVKYRRLFYYEVIIRENFACASDIARLIILFLHGGIYIDVDTLPEIKGRFTTTDKFLKDNDKLHNEDVCVAKTAAILMTLKNERVRKEPLFYILSSRNTLNSSEIESIINLIREDLSHNNIYFSKIGEVKVHKDFIKLSTLKFLDGVFFNNIICASAGSRFIRIVLRKIFLFYQEIARNGYLDGMKCPASDALFLSLKEKLSYYRRDRINNNEYVTNYLTGPDQIVRNLLFVIRYILGLNNETSDLFILRLIQNNEIGLVFNRQTLDTPNGIKLGWKAGVGYEE